MRSKEEVIKKLRENGFKLTPQRELVLDLFLKNRTHPTAEDVYQEAIKKFKYISRSTVYNTLDALVSIAEAKKITIKGDKILYDPEIKNHFHFICEKCGAIYDLEDLELKFDLNKIKTEHKISRAETFVFGVCKNCLSKNKI